MKENVLESVPEAARAHKLRARRIRVADLKLGSISASARHASLGLVHAAVEDLSLHGLALVIEDGASQSELILGGDRIEQLTVDCDGILLYDGTAIVRRSSVRGLNLVVGLELESNAIDLGELHRRGTRDGFAERWREVNNAALQPLISPSFKTWVAEKRSFLEDIREFLQNEETKLQTEDRLSREEATKYFIEEAAPTMIQKMNEAVVELTTLVNGFSDQEHEVHRSWLRKQLLPFFRESPLLRRWYDKPLGYAGDYEMMNMIYRDADEGETLFGQVLNRYAAQESGARAVINRLTYLGTKIRTAALRVDRSRLRIASIGSGPAREIATLLRDFPEIGCRLDIALIDQDERAMSFCERTLSPLAKQTDARIQFIRESVRKLMVKKGLSEALGERDLIYSAGLFDYLQARAFTSLLGTLYEAIVPGGEMLIGNFSVNNPSRRSMEYFVDWFLLYRTPEEMKDLAALLRPIPATVEVESEPLGVNLFLHIRR